MQNSLLNFYYIFWMELNLIKPNPLSLGYLIEKAVYLIISQWTF